MSAQHTPGPRKPGAAVLRGVRAISAEMRVAADVKAGEGKSGREEAADIRAALIWISAAIAKATGSAS